MSTFDKDTYEPMPLDVDFVKQTLEGAAASTRLADVPGERP